MPGATAEAGSSSYRKGMESQGDTPAASTAVRGLPVSPAAAPSCAVASPWCLGLLNSRYMQNAGCGFCCRATTINKQCRQSRPQNLLSNEFVRSCKKKSGKDRGAWLWSPFR